MQIYSTRKYEAKGIDLTSDAWKALCVALTAVLYDETPIARAASVAIFMVLVLTTPSPRELVYIGVLFTFLMGTFGATPLWAYHEIATFDLCVLLSLDVIVVLLATWRYYQHRVH